MLFSFQRRLTESLIFVLERVEIPIPDRVKKAWMMSSGKQLRKVELKRKPFASQIFFFFPGRYAENAGFRHTEHRSELTWHFRQFPSKHNSIPNQLPHQLFPLSKRYPTISQCHSFLQSPSRSLSSYRIHVFVQRFASSVSHSTNFDSRFRFRYHRRRREGWGERRYTENHDICCSFGFGSVQGGGSCGGCFHCFWGLLSGGFLGFGIFELLNGFSRVWLIKAEGERAPFSKWKKVTGSDQDCYTR